MNVLVINAGSSSVKFQVFQMRDETVLCKGVIERIGISGTTIAYESFTHDEFCYEKEVQGICNHLDAMKLIMDVLDSPESGCQAGLRSIMAIGHRVVHGGEFFSHAVLIDEDVLQAIEDCSSIAPLHNPVNLMGIKACMELMPGVKEVAVFDTAFHQTMTPEYYLYALPPETYERFKIRRYGFHGTSHEYVSYRGAKLLNRPFKELKIISMHLGNGASIAAIKDGKTLDTSMGFTPLEGLVMGTRCGDIDPAIVYYLMEKLDLNSQEVDEYLNKHAGLLGLSGISNDLRDIYKAATEGNEYAQRALDIYALRVKGYIGNYIAKLNGCDCLIFTAGVGENAIFMREKICKDMDFLGIEIDLEKNKTRGQEAEISSKDSRVRVFVIPTNEELMIARETMYCYNNHS